MDSLIPSPSHTYCNGICEGCTLYPACPDETDEECSLLDAYTFELCEKEQFEWS